MRVTPGGTVRSQQFTTATVDETYGPWTDVSGCAYVTFYLTGVGTTSSGVVTFEEAAPKDISVFPVVPSMAQDVGNFSAITTTNASVVTGGLQVAVHLTPAAYCYVRARISTVIGGGGSVSCGLIAY